MTAGGAETWTAEIVAPIPNGARRKVELALDARRRPVFADRARRDAFFQGVAAAWRYQAETQNQHRLTREAMAHQAERIKRAAAALARELTRAHGDVLDALAMELAAAGRRARPRRGDALIAPAVQMADASAGLYASLRRGPGEGDKTPPATSQFVAMVAQSWERAFGRTPSAKPGGEFAPVLADLLAAVDLEPIGESALRSILKG